MEAEGQAGHRQAGHIAVVRHIVAQLHIVVFVGHIVVGYVVVGLVVGHTVMVAKVKSQEARQEARGSGGKCKGQGEEEVRGKRQDPTERKGVTTSSSSPDCI